MKIILASNNIGKIRELQSLLAPREFEIVPQQDLAIADIEETGKTFIENALLKARHASAQTGLPAIADDSGLCVTALEGAPGIYSARYAGEGKGSAANIEKLLDDLIDTPEEERDAFFYCCLVYITHADDPTPLICEGRWQGIILKAPSGDGGFGYDPVFFVPSENMSAAELTSERKNQISHRAIALKTLLTKL